MHQQGPGTSHVGSTMDRGTLPIGVRTWVATARSVLFLHRLGDALVPLAAIIAIYAALALFGVVAIMPFWLHWALLGVLFLCVIAAIWLGARSFRLPTHEQAVAKVEADSGLGHRPLSHLEDRQASNLVDPLATQLWRRHQARLWRAIGPLRLSWPASDLAMRDPFALRILAFVIVVAGLGLAWDDAPRRLLSGLVPRSADATSEPLSIEAWITPPGYTRLPPLTLAANSQQANSPGDAAQAVDVPVGSRLLVQVRGKAGRGSLNANGEAMEFQVVDAATQRLETILRRGNAISVAVGGEKFTWPIRIVPDAAPRATLSEPRSTDRGVLRLVYGATDDFGIVETRLSLTRKSKTFDLPVPIHAIDPRQVKGSSFQDFTAHPWAGLEVELRVVAKDALGQIGASAPRSFVLPERHFYHPIARAIIALRKQLSANPDQAGAVARGLRQLQRQPQAFDDDISTYLALDFAQRRLDAGTDEEMLGSIQQLMWDTALALEDGGVSLAMRELRRLQRALEEALANGASDEEIQRLMNELQQAMNEYLQQLQQQIAKALEKGMQLGALDENAIALSQQDLNDMLNQARRMAESGARDSARQMLDQLQNMLENLQMGMPMMADRDSQAQRMLGDLGRILRQQQQLLEDTFRMQRNRQPGSGEGELGQGPTAGLPGEAGQGAARQDALRQMLGDLMRRFSNMTGDIPSGMGSAEQAMRGATDALRGEALEDAARNQNEALQSLQQSLQQMSEMMRQQIGTRRGQGQREQMDPFGRALSEQDGPGGDAVARENQDRVPLDQNLDRSRQLFEELRSRRNEAARPRMERDYIDRLLRQF